MSYIENGSYCKDGGDVGGDYQLSGAPNRRFAQELEDGTWHVIDEYAYVVPGDMNAFDRDEFSARSHGYSVQTQTMDLTCTDLEDVGGTEIHSGDVRYDIVATDFSNMRDALSAARQHILSLSADDYQGA